MANHTAWCPICDKTITANGAWNTSNLMYRHLTDEHGEIFLTIRIHNQKIDSMVNELEEKRIWPTKLNQLGTNQEQTPYLKKRIEKTKLKIKELLEATK